MSLESSPPAGIDPIPVPAGTDGDGGTEVVRMLPVELLVSSPAQARKRYREKGLAQMAESIRQIGVMLPLEVRRLPDGRFELVAGEQRLRAAKRAGLPEVPCLVRERSDAEAARAGWDENTKRSPLSDLEKCLALLNERSRSNESWAQIAARVGLSHDRVRAIVSLKTLDESVQTAVLEDRISSRIAMALKPLSAETQRELLPRIIAERMSSDEVRVLSARIRAGESCDARSTPVGPLARQFMRLEKKLSAAHLASDECEAIRLTIDSMHAALERIRPPR